MVSNRSRPLASRGVWLDGEALATSSIPLVDDGRVHEVVVGLVEEDPKGFRNTWGLLGLT